MWFEDESRFGQQGTLTRVWAPTGSRPRVVRQTQYQYLWMFGAVCPGTGQSCGLLLPDLNTETVNIFLEEFASQLAPDVVALLVWDGAAFHRSHGLVVPENVKILQLPPYSPELNPIENLWHYLKSHYLSNRFYENYDALLDAAQSAWQAVCLQAGKIKTIAAVSYI